MSPPPLPSPQSDLRQVYELLFGVRNKWYNLGLALGLRPDTLNGILGDNSKSDIRLRKMLNICLDTSTSLTWSGLCEALRQPTVACNDVAEEIEAKFRMLLLSNESSKESLESDNDETSEKGR